MQTLYSGLVVEYLNEVNGETPTCFILEREISAQRINTNITFRSPVSLPAICLHGRPRVLSVKDYFLRTPPFTLIILGLHFFNA